jgi:hypothetical protein
MFEYTIVSLALAASLLTPFVFVAIRESVKRQRQEIIRDLIQVFHFPDAVDTSEIVPSFEFVKYKYFFKRSQSQDEDRGDFRRTHWIVSALPLVVITFYLNFIVICIIIHAALGIDIAFGVDWLSEKQDTPIQGWTIAAAYAGAYLYMIRAFFRAINNFDLSPLSFVGAAVNLLSGVVLALIFVYGFLHPSGALAYVVQGGSVSPPSQNGQGPIFLGAVLITAFAIGYLPQIASRNLIWSSRLRNYKKENVQVYKSFSAIPVEVIDGIDTEIRDRLADFHINAVQNLAAANPLMLFVETPYGVYQIMDWVAQAQLCCSVGAPSLVKLWDLGIRTIFDLERAGLDPACSNPALLRAIGNIIMSSPGVPADELNTETIIADIRLRLEHPHVQRLRQLFIRVRDRLGDESRRLPPIGNCPFDKNPKCPFSRVDAANAA